MSRRSTCVFALAILIAPVRATAFPAPPPQSDGGGHCPALLRSIPPEKLWIGKFSGGRDSEIDFESEAEAEDEDVYTTEACFKRKADCERWMYRLKSMYQDQPRWSYCVLFTRQPRNPPRW
jgi:hypothetical protein